MDCLWNPERVPHLPSRDGLRRAKPVYAHVTGFSVSAGAI